LLPVFRHRDSCFDALSRLNHWPRLCTLAAQGMVSSAHGHAAGRIFNIQRFSVHDGPGVRTTVFLKGCPARCLWCHNPESQAAAPELIRSPERCVKCGSCVAICPHALCPDDIDPRRCAGCELCAGVCPTGARAIVGRTMTVAEVLADVERDRVFYEGSAGGLTVSGGEPFAQSRFLHSLLSQAKQRGLATAVETCGAASRAALLAAAPLVDLFLYDLKTSDADRHREYIGLPLAPILANLSALAAVHSNIWIRIPIVPGYTDDETDLARTARIVAETRGIKRVHLLPYHATGTSKFARLGRECAVRHVTAPAAERMESLAAIFRARGLETHIGG
jgi:pyruvate formate lyase activating enzyme